MSTIVSKAILLLLVIVAVGSCRDGGKHSNSAQGNSAVENLESLEGKLVHKILDAMGGQKAWDDLKVVSWTFFGSRHLTWDKENGLVRIESDRDTTVYITNLETLEGRYWKNGVEEIDKVVLADKMKKAKSIWINDSYWLFMPFKLLDDGVTLKYIGEDTLSGGQPSHLLELTFQDVGDTPDNKYVVHIDKSDNLIKQWDYFSKAEQNEPSRSWPWDNYQQYGTLLLSSDRSDNGGPSNVRVYESIDRSTFADL